MARRSCCPVGGFTSEGPQHNSYRGTAVSGGGSNRYMHHFGVGRPPNYAADGSVLHTGPGRDVHRRDAGLSPAEGLRAAEPETSGSSVSQIRLPLAESDGQTLCAHQPTGATYAQCRLRELGPEADEVPVWA